MRVRSSSDGRNYDPTFLADAADVILVSNDDVNWMNSDYGTHGSPYDTDYPPLYIGPDLWDGDTELGVPQAIAMRALSGSTEPRGCSPTWATTTSKPSFAPTPTRSNSSPSGPW